jgi:hypothetical protein
MMASKHSNKAAAAASSASFWTAELNAHHHLSHAHNRTPIAAVTAPSPVKNEKYVPKPEKPIVLESECHVTHGRVYKKGGESVGLMGKQFKERYLALEGLILVFYDKKGGSRKDAFRITSDCEAMPNPAGKNKGIRFDFDLVNTESGDQRTIYCDSDSEMLNWVDTINYVVDCCAEANENAAENLRQKLQKSAESSAKSNAAIMDSQENVDRAYATIKANTLEVTNHTVRVHELQQIRKEAEKLHEADAGLAAAAANHAAPPDPFELEKLRDEAQCHSAYGTGLYEAFRGEPSTFVIQACDSSGDPKTLGGDSFLVTIESEEHSDVKWDITPLDNGDGTYFVEYTPTRVGEWSLHVMQFSTLRSGAVVQAEIYGSPFHPIVAKSPTSASHCIVVGAGKDMARLPPIVPSVGGNVFTITARDMFDEDRGIGGDQFQIDIDGPALANSILDRGDGTYEVSYDINEDSPAFVNAMKQASAGVSSPLFLTIHLKLNNPGFPYPRPVGLFSVKGLKVPVDLSSRFPEGTIAPPALVIQQPTTHHQSESAHLPSSLPLLPPQLPISHALLPPPPPLSLLPQATVHIPVSSTSSTNSSSPLALIEPAVSATTSVSPSQHHHHHQQQQPEEVTRLKAELAESERQMREALEAMAEERKALAEQKAEVERKMVQMQELSKKIMSDSERLAEQARAMRQAQVMAAAAAAASAASSSTAAPVGYSPSLAEKPYPSSATYASPPMQQQQQQQQGLVSSSPVASSSTFPLQQQQQQQQQQTKSPYIVSQEEHIQPFVQQQQRPIAAASSSSLGVTSTIAAPSSTTALSELFDPEIMSLFDKHKRALVALWSFYTAMSRGEDGTHSTPASGTDLKRFIELFMDFDIAPTFLTKREIKAIFAAASSAHNINGSDGLSTSPLTYAAFNEALGRAALVALSKPAFQSLYPTAKDKVGVLLEMWGVADPRKLREVQDKIAMEGSKGGSAASVAKSRASVSTSGRK